MDDSPRATAAGVYLKAEAFTHLRDESFIPNQRSNADFYDGLLSAMNCDQNCVIVDKWKPDSGDFDKNLKVADCRMAMANYFERNLFDFFNSNLTENSDGLFKMWQDACKMGDGNNLAHISETDERQRGLAMLMVMVKLRILGELSSYGKVVSNIELAVVSQYFGVFVCLWVKERCDEEAQIAIVYGPSSQCVKEDTAILHVTFDSMVEEYTYQLWGYKESEQGEESEQVPVGEEGDEPPPPPLLSQLKVPLNTKFESENKKDFWENVEKVGATHLQGMPVHSEADTISYLKTTSSPIDLEAFMELETTDATLKRGIQCDRKSRLAKKFRDSTLAQSRKVGRDVIREAEFDTKVHLMNKRVDLMNERVDEQGKIKIPSKKTLHSFLLNRALANEDVPNNVNDSYVGKTYKQHLTKRSSGEKMKDAYRRMKVNAALLGNMNLNTGQEEALIFQASKIFNWEYKITQEYLTKPLIELDWKDFINLQNEFDDFMSEERKHILDIIKAFPEYGISQLREKYNSSAESYANCGHFYSEGAEAPTETQFAEAPTETQFAGGTAAQYCDGFSFDRNLLNTTNTLRSTVDQVHDDFDKQQFVTLVEQRGSKRKVADQPEAEQSQENTQQSDNYSASEPKGCQSCNVYTWPSREQTAQMFKVFARYSLFQSHNFLKANQGGVWDEKGDLQVDYKKDPLNQLLAAVGKSRPKTIHETILKEYWTHLSETYYEWDGKKYLVKDGVVENKLHGNTSPKEFKAYFPTVTPGADGKNKNPETQLCTSLKTRLLLCFPNDKSNLIDGVSKVNSLMDYIEWYMLNAYVKSAKEALDKHDNFCDLVCIPRMSGRPRDIGDKSFDKVFETLRNSVDNHRKAVLFTKSALDFFVRDKNSACYRQTRVLVETANSIRDTWKGITVLVNSQTE